MAETYYNFENKTDKNESELKSVSHKIQKKTEYRIVKSSEGRVKIEKLHFNESQKYV